VAVALDEVFIRPAKVDGTEWDFPRDVSQETIRAVEEALDAANPLAALEAAYLLQAISVLSRPDAEGDATLLLDGRPVAGRARALVERREQLTPSWQATWEQLDLADDVAIRIELEDADLLGNDDIGTVVLPAAALRAARDAGGRYGIRVDGQDRGQILMVAVTVR